MLVDGHKMFEVHVGLVAFMARRPYSAAGDRPLKPLCGDPARHCAYAETLAIINAAYMKPAPFGQTSKSPWASLAKVHAS